MYRFIVNSIAAVFVTSVASRPPNVQRYSCRVGGRRTRRRWQPSKPAADEVLTGIVVNVVYDSPAVSSWALCDVTA